MFSLGCVFWSFALKRERRHSGWKVTVLFLLIAIRHHTFIQRVVYIVISEFSVSLVSDLWCYFGDSELPSVLYFGLLTDREKDRNLESDFCVLFLVANCCILDSELCSFSVASCAHS